MKKGLVKLIAGALAGMFLLSGCDALPKGSDGPREVPQTITADFTKKENKGNWVTYGPTSASGVSASAGIIGSAHGFTLKAGVNTIGFKYMEIEAGIGWMF